MLREGDAVSWVGDAIPGGLSVGDTGTVASSSGESGHVLWSTGARRGKVDLVEEMDVVPAPATQRHAVVSSLRDSLGFETTHTAAREVFEEAGAAGLLSAMHERGDLAGFPSIADGAAEFVSARLREDPDFGRTLAALDETEADSLVSLASTVLLRDAFTPMEEDR